MGWEKLPPIQLGRHDATASILKVKGELFGVLVAGGHSPADGGVLSSAQIFEWQTKRWWALPNLPVPKSGCASASIGNRVIVVGGLNGQTHYDTVESFSFGSKAWQSLPPMSTPRWYCSAVGLEHHNCIVIMGGRNDVWQELATVECCFLTPPPSTTTTATTALNQSSTISWKTLAPMKCPRFACAAIPMGPSRIVVVGGYDGHRWLTSVELYDFQDDEWSELPPMPYAVSFVRATTVAQPFNTMNGGWIGGGGVGQLIFVLGLREDERSPNENNESNGSGANRQNTKQAVLQCYNVLERKWIKVVNDASSFNHSLNFEGSSFTSIGTSLVVVGGGGGGGGGGGTSSEEASKQAFVWNIRDLDLTRGDDDVSLPQRSFGRRGTNSSTQAGGESAGGSANETPVPPAFNPSGESSFRSHVPSAVVVTDQVSVASTAGFQSVSGVGRCHSRHPSHAVDEGCAQQADILEVVSPQPEFESSGENSASLEEPRRSEDRLSYTDRQGDEGLYNGEVSSVSGLPHGQGHMQWHYTGNVYDGEWRNGYRTGYGRMIYDNGDSFEGWFRKDQKCGRGTYQWKGGRQYEGLYVDDRAEDPNGTMTWKNGTTYIGSFVKGQRTGKAVIRFPNNVRYQGDFVDGKYDGFGTCIFADGRVYTGAWRKGKAHGRGKLTEADGSILHDGDWSHDVPVLRTS